MRPRDTAALVLVGVVVFFVVTSMGVVIIFAFEGIPSGQNIWAGMFSIVTAILGAIGGYLTRQAASRTPPKEDTDGRSR